MNYQTRTFSKAINAFYPSLWIIAFLLFASSVLSGQSVSSFHGSEANAKIEGALLVEERGLGYYPASVRFAPERSISFNEFFPWFNQTFDVPEGISFKLTKQTKDQLGMEHFRYKQLYKGVPIDKSHYIVHTLNGKVIAFNGMAFKVKSEVTSTMKLAPQVALEHALNHIGASKYAWEDEVSERMLKETSSNPEATSFPEANLTWHIDEKFNLELAYYFDIHAAIPHSYQRIYISAISGEVLRQYPLESNCEPAANFTSIWNGTRSVTTEKHTNDDFRLRDDCQTATIHVRDWNSDTSGWDPNNWLEIENTTNTWTTSDEQFGATVLWATKSSYAYFLNTHSRQSFDDADGPVLAFINARFGASHTQNNASMGVNNQGTGIMRVGRHNTEILTNSYGTVDIVGHEYTHAVTQTSSDLVYAAESGALNESFSDIFGEAIERFTLGSNDWLMGGERGTGAIRSLSNPKAFSQPDTYQGTNWWSTVAPCNSGNDNCGVHFNSGVQNYWFYLVSVGGSGTNDNNDDYDVQGIGFNKAAAISFRNLVTYLGPNSDHADARSGAINATIDLYGLCSPEYETVVRAWHAVGVGNPFFNATASVTSDYNGRDISCFGECDGAAAVSTANSTGGALTYTWSTVSGSSAISNLCADTYTVTVTDGNGCVATASIEVTQPFELYVLPTILSDYSGWPISCHGACDGEAALIAGGGTSPLSHQWYNGPSTELYENMCAGTYSGFVTDVNGCVVISEEITLDAPPPLEIEAGSNQTIFYYDPLDACTDLEATGMAGGVPPYSITWSVNNIVIGNDEEITVCMDNKVDTVTTVVYTVTITDANGCTETDELSVCYVDIRCQQGKSKQTHVIICHIPPDNPSNTQTLCVSLNALADHMSHGDYVFKCDWISPCDDANAKMARHLEELISNPITNGNALLDAYPNPFNSSTTIRFSLADEQRATLKVYDITGRFVMDLFDGTMQANQVYEVQLDGNSLATGSYFYRLATDDGEMNVKKLMLAR